jgi:hypothetical protein
LLLNSEEVKMPVKRRTGQRAVSGQGEHLSESVRTRSVEAAGQRLAERDSLVNSISSSLTPLLGSGLLTMEQRMAVKLAIRLAMVSPTHAIQRARRLVELPVENEA